MRMNYIKILMGLMSFIMVGSCAKPETQKQSPRLVDLEFYSNISSRTFLDGSTVKWDEGDSISVFDGKGNNLFTASSGGASAVFYGSAAISGEYYAAYPYDKTATMSEGTISMSVPVIQRPVLEGFAHRANLAVAKAEGQYLQMMNVCGYIKFSLSSSDINKIEIIASGGEKIAGPVSVSLKDGIPMAEAEENAVSMMTLLPESDGFAPGNYYAVLRPCSLSSGLSFIMYKHGGTVLIKNVSIIDGIVRRQPLNIGSLEADAKDYTKHIALAPGTRTSIYPGQTEAILELDTQCPDVTATVEAGATLKDVFIQKQGNTTFRLTFSNESDDPQTFNEATVVFRASGAEDLSVTIKQNGPLVLDFSNPDNIYGIPTTEPASESSLTHRTLAGRDYQIKYFRCYWHGTKKFIFKGGSAQPWGYIAFPALEGLRLSAIKATAVYHAGQQYVKSYSARVMNYDDTDTKVYAPSISFTLTEDVQEETAEYLMPETRKGVSYKLARTGNNNSFMKRIELYYED